MAAMVGPSESVPLSASSPALNLQVCVMITVLIELTLGLYNPKQQARSGGPRILLCEAD